MPAHPLPLPLSAKARRTEDSPINGLIAAKLANPDLINFAAGLVDDSTLPVAEVAAITARIFGDARHGRVALQYGTTIGLRRLRQILLEHLEKLEHKPAASMGLTADDMILTTGSQQALLIVADVLLDPGDIVITGNPSYFVFTGALQSLGANVLAVPMDEDGMDVEAIAKILDRIDSRGQLSRVKFIYCTSFFDNPTGLSLSLERRSRMLEIVQRFSREHRILILEDGAYRELRFDGPAMPSIKSFDADNRYTILTQTFSKPFSPGIKVGYTAMPADLLEHVLKQKGSHDFGSANICQEIACEAMADGSYLRHLEVLKGHYRQKRDATVEALSKSLPRSHDLFWTTPRGGLYVWLTLPKTIDTSREGSLFARCVKNGVMYVPGAYCFNRDESGAVPSHHMRLCYGQVPLEEIGPGIARLAEAIQAEMEPEEAAAT